MRSKEVIWVICESLVWVLRKKLEIGKEKEVIEVGMKICIRFVFGRFFWNNVGGIIFVYC